MEYNVDSPLSWFNLRWFLPATLREFSWDQPVYFWLLLLIPVVFIIKYIINALIRQRLLIALPEKEIRWSPVSLLRYLPDLILGLAVILLIIALARPQSTNEKVEQWTEGIDIMLVVDISESMQIEDFRPNRLEAAKKVATDFISGRFQDRIGLVIFSGEAYSLSPLTLDYKLLYNYIRDIGFNMIESRGTAIGSALAVATNRMRESKSKSKVLILLSDGDSNAGNIDPITAAELASSFGIKIYTIAVGKEGAVPFGKDFFGRTRFVDNTLDESNLRKIAEIGEGKFFRVSDNQALEQVFSMIDQYEKAEIKETRFKDTRDYYVIYLQWAALLLIAWMALKSTFIANVLQD
jgi:Ca-activated chloride channel family protein